MREELRAEIVRALTAASTLLDDEYVDGKADLLKLASEVRSELERGDDVLCPTSKFAQEQSFGDEPFTVIEAFWHSDTVVLLAPDGYTVELAGWGDCTRVARSRRPVNEERP